MREIAIEMVPDGVDPVIADYMIRQFAKLNDSLLSGQDFVPQYTLPLKFKVGQAVYFGQAIAPDITSEGLWLYTSAGWKPVAVLP